MWMLLYNADPERGFLNAIMVLLGLEPVAWLAEMKIVIYALFITLTWKFFGFHMLLYLTGLQNIPKEIEEAARIDGANAIQIFLFIIVPLLGSTIKTSVYLSVLGCIQQFILVWVMTKGGAGQCKRNDGHVYVSFWFCKVPAWIWVCGCNHYVHFMFDLFISLSGAYA